MTAEEGKLMVGKFEIEINLLSVAMAGKLAGRRFTGVIRSSF